MPTLPFAPRGRAIAAVIILTMLAAGCDPLLVAPPSNNRTSVPPPGANFTNAPLLFADGETSVSFRDSLAADDVHVYLLGALVPGDRLIVDVKKTTVSSLDPNVAVFDAAGNLFTLNDDVDLTGGNFNAHVDEVMRFAEQDYYLAIAPSFFGGTSGGYDATVQLIRGGDPVGPAPQVVFLNFAGGKADLRGIGNYNLSPFNAADVDSSYAGQTAAMRQIIIDVTQENYAGLDVVILNSQDHARPAAPFSEIYFGEFNTRAFGISEQVDHWNADPSDKSIIYTNDFDDPFFPQPSADELAVAIGNVVAHEIGHLLGLEHTADVSEIMDTTGRASTLLDDQSFHTAILDDTVFPIGNQDSMLILQTLLGVLASGSSARVAAADPGAGQADHAAADDADEIAHRAASSDAPSSPANAGAARAKSSCPFEQKQAGMSIDALLGRHAK